ncbi:MAG: Uncharacterised protein [Flavobacterium sp. SCGC AAA160-P02]|nr:MAG: Uncharacterised protein [Flavobacterium sp. SCGC AAA160-P02]
MEEYANIQNKLSFFYKKYYTSNLIKGAILFCSLGALYFLITLYIELFFWLPPLYRTLLFWVFIFMEVILFSKLILIPLAHLLKISKGINELQSSKMIGDFFPEVQDKLLNILQLKESSNETALILASIEQKAQQIKLVPFTNAIRLKKNAAYLKYLLFPILLWAASFLTGTNKDLSSSFGRFVNHKTAFIPPAPFSFSLEKESLQVIQGNSRTITVTIIGDIVPEEVKIVYNNQTYFLQEESRRSFSFTFTNVLEPIRFHLVSGGVASQDYTLNVLKPPTIQNVLVDLKYPKYTKKKEEQGSGSGILIVPEGTKITWQVATHQSDSIYFIEKDKRTPFKQTSPNTFNHKHTARKALQYQISSSNNEFKDYEKLSYSLSVIKDAPPSITVASNIDSLQTDQAMFAGHISDDYGISNLSVFYYIEEYPEKITRVNLESSEEKVQTFFYQFPNQLDIEEGATYKIYYQVSDNDAINGRKQSVSKTFTYRKKTKEELDHEELKKQRAAIQNLEKSIQNYQQEQELVQQFQIESQIKRGFNWNDKKKIEELIKRQKQYEEMMDRQTDLLQETLYKKGRDNQLLNKKKEDLQKRIEELKKLNRKNKLLEELQKATDKLNKEELLQKTKQLAKQNKQQEKSIERILELIKRFYVEEKTVQIANKLEALSKKQDKLTNRKENVLEKQKEIRKQFDNLANELEDVIKENDNLREPMNLPELQEDINNVNEELSNAEIKLNKQQPSAKKNQQRASKIMKKMSQKMQQAISDMQAASIEENTDDLRKILENLVSFSFKQEALLEKFNKISIRHPEFGNELKKQNQLRAYFEHIDDSLFVLSLRIPQLSSKIQTELTNVEYHLNRSLENFSENLFYKGSSSQQQALTSVNNLSDFLSDFLNNLQNSIGSGKGKPFSLPTLIQQQKNLSEEIKKGVKRSENKTGDQKGKAEERVNEEVFKIYQEQSRIKNQLYDAIKNQGKGLGKSMEVLKTMEQLENDILEKGFTQQVLQKMQLLDYELLKLDKASLKQGEEKQKKSKSSTNTYQKKSIREIKFKKLFYDQIEILNRQSLPLHEDFEKKVQLYFLKKNKE